MTIVVGFSATAPGRAALTTAVSEAQLRGQPLLVINSSRGDAFVDGHFASAETLAAVREKLDATGVVYEIEQPVRGREGSEEVVDVADRVHASLIVIGMRRRRMRDAN